MTNEGKAKRLIKKTTYRMEKLITTIQEKADLGRCKIRNWDKRFGLMLHDFIEAVCVEFIPLDAGNYEDDYQEYVKVPKKEYEPRKAIPFEQAVLEMKTKVKAIDEETISILVKRILLPAYKRYLEQEKKRSFNNFF